jgi:tricorn protease
VTSAGYLRFPHLHNELIAFIAEDDVWLGPAGGGRAWRVSADQAPASHPRIARDGTMIAWTSRRDGPPEVYLAGVDGGNQRRLTYWSDAQTRVCGWTPDGAVLAVTAARQPFSHFTWAYAVPASAADGGDPAGDATGDGVTGGAAAGNGAAGNGAAAARVPGTRRLPFGPVADLAIEDTAVALLTSRMARDPAAWKRYRGGTAGRLWLATAAPNATAGDPPGPFTRVLGGLAGQFASPMLAGGRLAFLSDHEGTGNL